MKILINIGHPAHVHLFKNMIYYFEKKGHLITIVTRDKDVTLKLLDLYKFDYILMSGYYNSKLGKMYDFVKTDLKLLKIAMRINPDVLIAVGDPYIAHVGKLIGKPSIVFTDTEHAKLANNLTTPFATIICTPSCFKKDLGEKHVRYNGYHELAYLHPNYFKPDSNILGELGLNEKDIFIIFRFVSWNATHDMGHTGLSLDEKIKLVDNLSKIYKVFITSESDIPPYFEKYQLKLSPERIHDILYYASLYIGDGATMATEAGILGTPSIYVSSLVGTMGNFVELEQKYGLVYAIKDQKDVFDIAIGLLEDHAKEKWKNKREKMLREKIDVTQFIIRFIEEYPESFYEYKRRQGKL